MARSLLITVLLALPLTARALTFEADLGDLPFPWNRIPRLIPTVFIQVGSGQRSDYGLLGPPGQVEEITFPFPAGVQLGDGTPVAGTPVMPIGFYATQRGGAFDYRVTVDSSVPLDNGAGDVIPFSDFSWTTQDGDIPPGRFNSGNQVLLQRSGPASQDQGVVDYLTFSYANTRIYPPGTYSGRVTFTITQL